MKKKRLLILIGSICLSLVLLVPVMGACAKPAPVSVEEFYKENTVINYNPGSPGGSTDFGSRLFSAYWPDVTGGNMQVRAMSGGEGLIGFNALWNAEPDGLAVTTNFNWASMFMGPILEGNPAVKYDPAKVGYLGGLAVSSVLVAFSPKLGAENLRDLKDMSGLKFGIGDMGPGHGVDAIALLEWLDLEDAKLISGFHTEDLGLAAARGEVDVVLYALASTLSFEEKGWVKLVATFTPERMDILPDLPAIPEQLDLTEKQMEEFRFFATVGTAPRPFITSPGVPADRLQFLRDAFLGVTALKGFQKSWKRRWPVWTDPWSGEKMEKFAHDYLELDLERIEAWIGKWEKYK